MKTIFFAIILAPLFLQAQEVHLEIKGTQGNLYLNHIAAVKENFDSLSRLYNISSKEIIKYNKLNRKKNLKTKQLIKIPLKDVNFSPFDLGFSDQALVPLHHKVNVKETLNTISVKYKNVSVADLKRWNDLYTDALKPGKELVIGFLIVNKEISALGRKGIEVSIGEKSIEIENKKSAPPVILKDE